MEVGTIGDLVKTNFAPTILVLCTPDAEAVCKRNKTTLVQLCAKYAYSFTTVETRGKII